MSRVSLGCVVLLITLAMPLTVPAQGLMGSLLPSLGEGDDWGVAKPPFRLTGDAAFTYQTIDLGFEAHRSGLNGVANIRHNYSFGGISLGITAAVVLPRRFGAMANATVLVVSSSRDEERYNESGAGPPRRRCWNTDNGTYSLEGAGFVTVYGGACLLGGFRWDHLETTFNRPDSAVNIASLPGDEGVLVVNAYQPYVGALIDQGGPYRRLRVGVLGWPQMYGSLKYGETDGAGAAGVPIRIDNRSTSISEGYFLEIFGDYGVRESSVVGATVSVFAKWTQYHYKGVLDSDANVVGAGTFASDDFDLSIQRNAWSAGVRIHVPFAVPFL